MIYVYAIVDSPRPEVAGLSGLGGVPLGAQPCATLSAVISRGHAGRAEPSAENALCHGQVVEGLMPRHAVLPARFGTVFHEQSDLEATLERTRERLARGLERVRGHVELGLRVLWEPREGSTPSAAPPSQASGRDYMMARLAEERRRREERRDAEQVADELHPPLAALAADSTRRVLVAPDFVLSAAYLVRGERTAEFREAVRRLAAGRPALRLLCTGPWPPYHFVPSIVEAAEAMRE